MVENQIFFKFLILFQFSTTICVYLIIYFCSFLNKIQNIKQHVILHHPPVLDIYTKCPQNA